jgi:hypothetical protein
MSGSTIGGVVGGVIGAYFGNAQLGWMIGSAIGGYVDPDVIKGPRLKDAQVQTSQEGVPRPIVFGTAVVAGNVIQRGPLIEHKHKERTGKGGPEQVTYTYTRTYAIRVCEGPIAGIRRIWRDDKLIYDVRDPSTPDDGTDPSVWQAAAMALAGDTQSWASKLTIYLGDETQLPDPTLEALPAELGGGAGNVPAYRGSAYVVIANDDLTDRQGTLPQYRFEVVSCGDTVTIPGEDPPWIHSFTGTTQSIFDIGADQTGTFMVSGWNDNLRITTNGSFWSGVDYSGTGISTSLAIADIWNDGGWYFAVNQTVASPSSGRTWDTTIIPAYPIHPQSVGKVAGTYWAGVHDVVGTTKVFQPRDTVGSTVIDYGANYGIPECISDTSAGEILLCTTTGKILKSGVVVHDTGGVVIVTQFARHGTTIVGAFGGGYLLSTDDGTTWTTGTGPALDGVAYSSHWYGVTNEGIYATDDPAGTWTLVDDYFVGNGGGSYICASENGAVLATTQDGKTAYLPAYRTVPDAPSFQVDDSGNLYGPDRTGIAPCGDITVADVVESLCSRVGITAGQMDLTQLTDVVRGVVIGRQMACADAIRSLQQGYFFDFPEWDLKLRGVMRGGAALWTITDDDLVWSDDDEETRAQSVEFPRKINLESPDPAKNYEAVKQTAERRTENIKALGETTIELPIVQTADERARTAEKMLKIAWEEANGRTQFQLPEEFTALTPSDPFTKDSKRWRADKVEYGDGVVKVEAVRDRISAYTSAAVGNQTDPGIPPSSIRGPTIFSALNLPSLRTQDNTPGMYVAAKGLLPGWIGCDLQLSVDGGETYTTVLRMTNHATLGVLTADQTAAATTLSVDVGVDTLESATASQVIAGANLYAIPNANDTAEVSAFQTATETDTGEYDLSTLTRPKLDTTAAEHYAGDRFVLLDSAIYFLPIDVRYAGQTLIFRPVTLGTAAENNATFEVVYLPQFTSAPTVDFLETELGEVITTETGEYLQLDIAA